jgi:hypothetical protein
LVLGLGAAAAAVEKKKLAPKTKTGGRVPKKFKKHPNFSPPFLPQAAALFCFPASPPDTLGNTPAGVLNGRAAPPGLDHVPEAAGHQRGEAVRAL